MATTVKMASTVYETEISIGATRNMKSRLAISLPPGEEKASNALGMPGGRMLKLRFDWCVTTTFNFHRYYLTRNLLNRVRLLREFSDITSSVNVKLNTHSYDYLEFK